jgi:Zn-dependent metalloprotease
MARLPLTAPSHVTYDSRTRAVRTWLDTTSPAPESRHPFEPRQLAHQTLRESADLFQWSPELPNLRDRSVLHGDRVFSVRFFQTHKEVPVDSSDVVVNLYGDGRVHSIYNGYHYEIPQDLDPQSIRVRAAHVRDALGRLLERFEKKKVPDPSLIVYRYQRPEQRPLRPGFNARRTEERQAFLRTVMANAVEAVGGTDALHGRYFLAWDARISTEQPTQYWRVLVDAMSGGVIQAIDLLEHATGVGWVLGRTLSAVG